MSNFSALIATIQANIKTNGNEEITGAVLQDVLEAMVDALGTEAINDLEDALATEVTNRTNADGTLQNNIDAEALRAGTAEAGLDGRLDTIEGEIPSAASSSNKLADKAYVDAADLVLQTAINGIKSDIENGYVYAGIATTSMTPVTGKVFYLAVTAGTYTNFGGLVVTQGINILKYNGTAWSQEQLIGIDDVPTADSDNLVESGGVYKRGGTFYYTRASVVFQLKNKSVTLKAGFHYVQVGKDVIFVKELGNDTTYSLSSYRYLLADIDAQDIVLTNTIPSGHSCVILLEKDPVTGNIECGLLIEYYLFRKADTNSIAYIRGDLIINSSSSITFHKINDYSIITLITGKANYSVPLSSDLTFSFSSSGCILYNTKTNTIRQDVVANINESEDYILLFYDAVSGFSGGLLYPLYQDTIVKALEIKERNTHYEANGGINKIEWDNRYSYNDDGSIISATRHYGLMSVLNVQDVYSIGFSTDYRYEILFHEKDNIDDIYIRVAQSGSYWISGTHVFTDNERSLYDRVKIRVQTSGGDLPVYDTLIENSGCIIKSLSESIPVTFKYGVGFASRAGVEFDLTQGSDGHRFIFKAGLHYIYNGYKQFIYTAATDSIYVLRAVSDGTNPKARWLKYKETTNTIVAEDTPPSDNEIMLAYLDAVTKKFEAGVLYEHYLKQIIDTIEDESQMEAPSFVYREAESTYKRYIDWKGTDDAVIIAFTTDLHIGNTKKYEVLKWMQKTSDYFGYDALICGGDLAPEQTADAEAAVQLMVDISRNSKGILCLRGNHDAYSNVWSQELHDVTAKIVGNGMLSSIFGEPNKKIYNLDWDNKNCFGSFYVKDTLVLLLNVCGVNEYNVGGNFNEYYCYPFGYTNKEINYIINKLGLLSPGQNVIIFSHIVDNEIGSVEEYPIVPANLTNGVLLNTILKDFVNKDSGSEGSISWDFTNIDESCKLIGSIGGHGHYDCHVKENGINYIVRQGYGMVDPSWTLPTGAVNTPFNWDEQCCYDVFAIKPSGDMKVFRIGAGGANADLTIDY